MAWSSRTCPTVPPPTLASTMWCVELVIVSMFKSADWRLPVTMAAVQSSAAASHPAGASAVSPSPSALLNDGLLASCRHLLGYDAPCAGPQVTRHDIGDKSAVGTLSEAYPHLIFESFTSQLGQRVRLAPLPDSSALDEWNGNHCAGTSQCRAAPLLTHSRAEPYLSSAVHRPCRALSSCAEASASPRIPLHEAASASSAPDVVLALSLMLTVCVF